MAMAAFILSIIAIIVAGIAARAEVAQAREAKKTREIAERAEAGAERAEARADNALKIAERVAAAQEAQVEIAKDAAADRRDEKTPKIVITRTSGMTSSNVSKIMCTIQHLGGPSVRHVKVLSVRFSGESFAGTDQNFAALQAGEQCTINVDVPPAIAMGPDFVYTARLQYLDQGDRKEEVEVAYPY